LWAGPTHASEAVVGPLGRNPSGHIRPDGPMNPLPGCPQDSYYIEMLKSMYGLCAVDPAGKVTNVFSEPVRHFSGFGLSSPFGFSHSSQGLRK